MARSAVPALAMHHDLDPARFIAPRCRVLYDVVVDPAHRGVGIGRQLLDATLAELKTGGASRVVLSTAKRNEVAQRLFARAGFRRTMIEMTRELSDD